jgi:predicted PurR-regulated permease PerM
MRTPIRPDGRSRRVGAIHDPRTLVGWTIVGVVLAAAIVWGLYLARRALVLVYVSALLTIGLAPVVRWIERFWPFGSTRYRPPRWLAVLSIYAVLLLAMTAIAVATLPPLVAQTLAFAASLPKAVEQGERYLIANGLLGQRVLLGDLVQQAPPSGDSVAAVVLTFWSAFGSLLEILTVLILTFYLLVDAETIFLAFVRLFPRQQRLQVRTICDHISTKVSAWLNGQLILGGTIGVAAAIELALLGVPYYFTLAVIAALGEMIPYVGPLISAVPAVLVAFTISPRMALVVAALYFVNQQFESQLLVPKVMERQVGLSPIGVIIALLVGIAFFGVVGAVLAVPTAAIAQVVFEELVPADALELNLDASPLSEGSGVPDAARAPDAR